MDSVCKELDEVKLELNKIKDEYQIKTELLKSLRKANDDQVLKYQEAKFQMEKLTKELSTKEQEMSESRRLYENVKHRLQETESSLKHASLVSEKLRIDCGEKVQKLEVENRKLVSALDAATSNNSELERRLCACRDEVAGLKLIVSGLQKKCLEAEQKVELKKALSNRDDAIMKLEEESVCIQDRLKWKTEQFDHLKEAHKLLQEQFQSSKKEWVSEKSDLLKEITSLQISLDTQIRMNDNLQTELKMCNQALAHEESRRKASEIQLSETKLCFENVLGEFDEAKSKIENMSKERDEEVSALRITLGTKNAHIKEMEYTISHLEHENKELLCSVKELQEAQIGKKKPDSSFIKLRNKLRDLEQAHNRCSTILEEREAEWNMKMEKMIEQVTRCEFDLKTKTEEISQLKLQVESCQSSIAISGEEISILLMVLKSEFSEVYSKMLNLAQKEEVVEKLAVSAKREIANEPQLKAQLHLEQASKEIASLSKKLEALKIVEGKNTSLENELDKCRKMLKESAIRQHCLEDHAALMEASAKETRDAKVGLQNEKDQLEQEWKRIVSVATLDADKYKQEAEELRIVAECNGQKSTRDFQTLEQNFMDATVNSISETFEMLIKNVALSEALENADYLNTTKIQEKQSLLEQNFMDATVSSFAETFEMLIKNGALREGLENAENLITAEVQEKRNLVSALEKESANMCEKLAHFEQSLLDSQNRAKEVEVLLEDKTMESESLKNEVQEKTSLVLAMEKESADLHAKIVLVEKSLLYSQNRVKEVEALLDHKTRETDSLKEDLGNLQGKYCNVENEVQEKKNVISALEKQSADLRAKIAHVEDSLLYSHNRVKELEALLDHKTSEMDSLKDLRAKILRVEESLLCSQNRAKELEGKYKKVDKELQEKKSIVSALEKESDDLRTKTVFVEESLLCSQNRVKELEVSLEHKTLEMESLVSALENESADLREKNGRVEESLLYSQNTAKELEALLEHKTLEMESLISALKNESADLREKNVRAEESLHHSQNRANELEALLDHKTLETDILKGDLENVQDKYKKVKKELELTKQALTEENEKSFHERESLIACIEGDSERIGGFCEDDAKLMGMLDKMLGHCKENEIVAGNKVDDSIFNNAKDLKGNLDRRACPLRELNQ